MESPRWLLERMASGKPKLATVEFMIATGKPKVAAGEPKLANLGLEDANPLHNE